jgi:tetratricopeptide (TPR) repeat protein
MNAAYYHQLGDRYAAQNQFEMALRSYQQALSLGGPDPELHLARGEVLRRMGRLNEALQEMRLAVELSPLHPGARLALAAVYQMQQQPERALSELNRAIELMPSNPEGYFQRGLFYQRTGQLRLALQDLNKAVSLGEGEMRFWAGRGRLYLAMGDAAEAQHDFSQALQINPDSPVLYYEMAQALKVLGRRREAAEALRTCLAGTQDATLRQKVQAELSALQDLPKSEVNLSLEVQREVQDLLRRGEKAEALKRVVQASGAGLKVARAYLDQLSGNLK